MQLSMSMSQSMTLEVQKPKKKKWRKKKKAEPKKPEPKVVWVAPKEPIIYGRLWFNADEASRIARFALRAFRADNELVGASVNAIGHQLLRDLVECRFIWDATQLRFVPNSWFNTQFILVEGGGDYSRRHVSLHPWNRFLAEESLEDRLRRLARDANLCRLRKAVKKNLVSRVFTINRMFHLKPILMVRFTTMMLRYLDFRTGYFNGPYNQLGKQLTSMLLNKGPSLVGLLGGRVRFSIGFLEGMSLCVCSRSEIETLGFHRSSPKDFKERLLEAREEAQKYLRRHRR